MKNFFFFFFAASSLVYADLGDKQIYYSYQSKQKQETPPPQAPARQDPFQARPHPDRFEPRPHQFTVGGKYTRAYLKPSANPSFSGNMGGAQASYEYRRPDFFYGALEFEWRYGCLHASNGSRKLQDINGQERLGYTFQVWDPVHTVTLFSGFGFRQLYHDVDLNGLSSIDLRYNHFYIPFGIFSQFKAASFLSIGFNATWYLQVVPTVTISPFNGARWKLRRQFKSFLAEIPFVFHLDAYVKGLSILFVPQFELWQDGPSTARSPSGISLGLPQNTYILWSGELSVKYAF